MDLVPTMIEIASQPRVDRQGNFWGFELTHLDPTDFFHHQITSGNRRGNQVAITGTQIHEAYQEVMAARAARLTRHDLILLGAPPPNPLAAMKRDDHSNDDLNLPHTY